MYAVVKTGGKQYRVAVGDRIQVESLKAEPGETVELDDVLLVADGSNVKIGTPTVGDATVKAKVAVHGRHKKVEIVKFKRRKGYKRTQGHRQNYTELEITEIA